MHYGHTHQESPLDGVVQHTICYVVERDDLNRATKPEVNASIWVGGSKRGPVLEHSRRGPTHYVFPIIIYILYMYGNPPLHGVRGIST